MAENAARNDLPFLLVGQAQKEITHNEALVIIDALLQPIVQGEQFAPPAGLNAQDAGKCWIVGASATGAWSGQDGKLAYWTADSWRFVNLKESSTILREDLGLVLIKKDENLYEPAAIPIPQGGATIDVEARAAISAILNELVSRAMIPF